MSIFGNLDVKDVNDDPFFVADDTYEAVCLEMRQGDKNGQKYVTFDWQITQPGEFHNRRRSNYISMPDLEGVTSMDQLSSKEQDDIKRLRRIIRLAFDVPEEKIGEFTPAEAQGRDVYITVKNSVDKNDSSKKYSNVIDWKSAAAFSEQAAQFDVEF